MQRSTLYFTAPYEIELRPEPLEPPGPGDVLVRTLYSGISSGTELLIYKGDFPEGISADASIDALEGSLRYPMAYGYSAVGEIIDTGTSVSSDVVGKHVFSFQPHTSHFISPATSLIFLNDFAHLPAACLLPNAETAVNFLMDLRPIPGENIIVFGQGIVGLLTTALLSRYPLSSLIVVDPIEQRRTMGVRLGADRAIAPQDEHTLRDALKDLRADASIELSGDPEVLNQAIRLTGYEGRILIGSWYGSRTASLTLGGRFHRSRLTLVSSQVSTLPSHVKGRWTKERRLKTAFKQVLDVPGIQQLITDVVPFEQAGEAYQRLAEQPHSTIQAVLSYHM